MPAQGAFDHGQNHLAGLIEVDCVELGLAQQHAGLPGEVGIGLCHRPQREQQVRHRHALDLAGFHPLLQQGRLGLEGGQQLGLDIGRAERGLGHDLQREQA